ncbi:hypothetical protein [Streptomyces acidiscabies]
MFTMDAWDAFSSAVKSAAASSA